MAPLPFNGTNILFVDYQNAVGQHTMLFRFDENLANSVVADSVNDFLLGISALMHSATILATRIQVRDTNFSIPVSIGLDGTGFGSGTANQETNATALTFVGRDGGGRRSRFSVFGFKGGLSNYRLLSTESADIANAVGVLNSRPGMFLSILHVQPLWYPYADVKANDYWVRRARS